MKVLVADKFEQSGLDGLRAIGCEVVYRPTPRTTRWSRRCAAAAPSVLVVRSTQVQAPVLDAGALSLIVRAGAGVNTIDVAGASRRGIYVSNCPGKNAVAVAELAMGLILALDRRIPDNVAELRAGTWNKKEYSKARGLHGRTLGLLGFGNIGQEVAARATRLRHAGRGLEPALRPPTPPSAHASSDAFGIAVVDAPEEVVAARRRAQRAPGARRRTRAASSTPRCCRI